MEFWEEFDSLFAFKQKITYPGKLATDIEGNRKALGNTLFIDRLLNALGIEEGMLLQGSLVSISLFWYSSFSL